MIASTASTASPRQMPGSRTYLTSSPIGVSLSGRRARTYAHPFTPGLSLNSIYFSRGVVDTFEPTIHRVPISGSSTQPQPSLLLTSDQVNDAGESWAVLEVEPDPTSGMITQESRLEIVHAIEPKANESERIGKQPIAQILWLNGRPARVIPIIYFNLRYYRHKPQSGPYRHLFL